MTSHATRPSSTQVAQGVRRLTGGVANFYLVEQDEALTLVDAGTPGDWQLFLRTVEQLGRRLDQLDAVLLTHAHADHTGFADRARREAPAGVWIHSDDAAVAQGTKPGKNDAGLAKYLARVEFYRTVISLSRRKGAKIIPIVELSTFTDGEILDVPGKPRVIHTPGHTPGNAALHFEDRETLISGDSLITHNPLTGRTGPQIMPSGFNRDTPQALASLNALESLNASIVLPGHGEPWHGPVTDAVQLARSAGPS